MSLEELREYRVKVIVVGSADVGKTSIIKRYVANYWTNAPYKPTVGVDFALKIVEWDPQTKIHLQLWDIAGQERFGTMTHVYYRRAVGVIICYDVSDPASFTAVENWRLDIKAKLHPSEDIPIILLGNKIDMKMEVPQEVAEKYASEHKFIGVKMVSAKQDIGIVDAIHTLIPHVINYVQNDTDRPIPKNVVVPGPEKQNPRRPGKCCIGAETDNN